MNDQIDVDANVGQSVEPQTVLLVDDDAKLLRGLQRSLADETFHVITSVSPVEATVLLKQQRVDLIVSDNLMAGSLGTEFLKDVSEQYPDIKLLMLSGYIPPAAAKRAVEELGVIQVLTKPCEAQDVAKAIREALQETPEQVGQ